MLSSPVICSKRIFAPHAKHLIALLASPTASSKFNVANEIAHELYPIAFVHYFYVCEFFLDEQDHQFNNVEPVESEIISEVRVNTDRVNIDCQMLSNESADLICT